MHSTTITLTFLAAVTQIAAYKVMLYPGQHCNGGAAQAWVGGPNEGCRSDWLGVMQGGIVSSTGAVDDNFMFVGFSSPDCNPTTIIYNGDENAETRCINMKDIKSYEVWDLSG